MRSIIPAAAAAAILASCENGEAPAAGESPACTDATRIGTLPPQLDEASGIVHSPQHPGIFWVHNDSEGTPALYAIDATGRLVAEIEIPGAVQSDWEDISTGPCPQGTCLYIGDIGDNLHDRDDRAILRIAEPQPVDGTVATVERFPFAYPDGARDAEALFVMPDGTVYIISKGRSGPVTVYRYPLPLRPDQRVMLERVQELTPGLVQLPELVTGADVLRDGSLIALRTYSFLRMYRFDGDTLSPLWPEPGFDLGPLAEPQGEGVALLPDGTVYLVSETGPAREPPPFSRLRCTLP
jgi:hypothetical protein